MRWAGILETNLLDLGVEEFLAHLRQGLIQRHVLELIGASNHTVHKLDGLRWEGKGPRKGLGDQSNG